MGRHAEGFDQLTYLKVDGDGLVSLFHPLFCVAGGEYEEGPGDLWEEKGEIPVDGFLDMANLTPLYCALNTLFGGAYWAEFDMHVTLLSSVHPRDLDTTAHQVAAMGDEGLHVMRSRRIALMPADIVQVVL